MSSTLSIPTTAQAVLEQNIEINVKGKWTRVPALMAGRETIVVSSGLIKLAVIHDEEWLEQEIEDPSRWVKVLKERGLQGTRPDVSISHKNCPVPSRSITIPWSGAVLPPFGFPGSRTGGKSYRKLVRM